MATAASSALGPVVKQHALEDATQAFQRILDDEQRRELLRVRQVPDADSILVFTAELDSINRNRKGRSFASRLYKFLSSTRDFCGIIGTYVSAHPEIAALVWGSIKLTMLVIANFTSYYDATSDLFMKLGMLCPLFSEYQILFHDSAGLRSSLDEFYASIVRCCKHVVQAIQRPWTTQLVKALQISFSQEFKADLDDIKRCGDQVKSQVYLAKAQADRQEQELQARERMEASRNRGTVKRFFAHTDQTLDTLQKMQVQSDRRKTRKRAKDLLDSLSTYDHLRLFKQSSRKRYSNTTDWIFKTPQFLQWADGGSSVIWSSGKIGCGKTVATASAIQHMAQYIPGCIITFFFLQTDDSESLQADQILRSLLRQRLNEAMISQELERALNQIIMSSNHSELIALLRKLMRERERSIVFIDGLDECSQVNRQELFQALSKLVSSDGNIQLYVSSRLSLRDEIQRHFPDYLHISLDCQATRNDIATYIEGVIDEKLNGGELKIGDPNLVGEIKGALVKGSQGMYIWAYFQIEEICSQHCDEDVRGTLNNLPSDLAEIFRRALRRITTRRHGPAAQTVFPWVAAAKRPLTLGEILEAIAIRIGQVYTETSRHYNDMERIASWCENLVQVDEEGDLVQFAHSSVKTFLTGKPTDPTLAGFHMDLEASDHLLGEICVTFLNFNDFKTTVAVPPARLRPLPVDPSRIAQTSLKPGSKRATLLSAVTPRSNTHLIDLQSSSAFLPSESPASDTLELRHPFLRYALANWLAHTQHFRPKRSITWTKWRSMLFYGMN